MKRIMLVLTVMSAAGCKNQIDSAKAEAAIKSGLEAKGAKVESISCPSGRAAKKGDTFDCTGKANGKDFTVGVEQLDDEGNVKWTLKTDIPGEAPKDEPKHDEPKHDEPKSE